MYVLLVYIHFTPPLTHTYARMHGLGRMIRMTVVLQYI